LGPQGRRCAVRVHRVRVRTLAVLLVGLATVAGCAGGLELLVTPTSVRVYPSLVTAAPGEVVNFSVRLYSIIGTRIPSLDEICAWTLSPLGDLPPGADVQGELDPKSAGVVTNTGLFEASPVVQAGKYRVGAVRAEIYGTFGSLSSHAFVVVDGNLDENAPSVQVFPQDAEVSAGGSLPFVTVAKDRESGRVTSTEGAVWSLTEGEGTLDAASGLYTAGGSAQEEVRVSVEAPSGRVATSYLSVVEGAPGAAESLSLLPSEALKVPIGRSQRYLAWATDRNGAFVPQTDAVWLVEGGIGAVTVLGDGTAEFIAHAAGRGTLSVTSGSRTASCDIVAVIPGA